MDWKIIGSIRSHLGRIRHYGNFIYVFSVFLIAAAIIGYFGLNVLLRLDIADENLMSNLVSNIMQGTLALGALALAVLAYSLAQMRSGQSPKERNPYRRISQIMFFVASISMADAATSATYLLTKDLFSFQVSVTLLFLVIIGDVVSVSLWILKELE
jgi:hypothetical protein